MLEEMSPFLNVENDKSQMSEFWCNVTWCHLLSPCDCCQKSRDDTQYKTPIVHTDSPFLAVIFAPVSSNRRHSSTFPSTVAACSAAFCIDADSNHLMTNSNHVYSLQSKRCLLNRHLFSVFHHVVRPCKYALGSDASHLCSHCPAQWLQSTRHRFDIAAAFKFVNANASGEPWKLK